MTFCGFPGPGRILRTRPGDGDLDGLGPLSRHPTDCRLHTPDSKMQTASLRIAELHTDNAQTHGDAETQDEVKCLAALWPHTTNFTGMPKCLKRCLARGEGRVWAALLGQNPVNPPNPLNPANPVNP